MRRLLCFFGVHQLGLQIVTDGKRTTLRTRCSECGYTSPGYSAESTGQWRFK